MIALFTSFKSLLSEQINQCSQLSKMLYLKVYHYFENRPKKILKLCKSLVFSTFWPDSDSLWLFNSANSCSSIYVFCTKSLSSLNIFYCLKLFYLNICSIYTSDSIYASYLNTLWYIRNAQILRVASSTALHAKNSCSSIYVFCTKYLSSLNIFHCLKLFYLNICSVCTSDSIYTN